MNIMADALLIDQKNIHEVWYCFRQEVCTKKKVCCTFWSIIQKHKRSSEIKNLVINGLHNWILNHSHVK